MGTYIKYTTGIPWWTTEDRLIPKADYVLLRKYALSGIDDTTNRRKYYWLPPSTEEVKGCSKG